LGFLPFSFLSPLSGKSSKFSSLSSVFILDEYAGDKMIYGDTDSIYLVSKDDTIIAKAAELDVTLEYERWWECLFLTPNKKQYFGITQEGKEVQKN
jgi:DNA polymerase elongation subunit (family B)